MDNNICAIVEYEYAAKEPDELDLQKGAIIHRIKQMPGGWWQGTLKSSGVTGMFPDNFVRVLESGISSNGNGTTGSGDHLDEGTSVQLRDKSATSNRRCKVIYSYTQVNDDELTLAVGDVIEFLGEVEEGWWRGRLRSKVGVFPSNFVQHIEPSPILASKRPPTIGATVTTSSLTSKAANVAASTTSTTTGGGGGGGGGSGGTTGTTSTAKQTTKSRVIAAATSAPAEPAAIASVLGSGATGSGGPAAAGPQIVPMLPPKPQREFCRVEFPYAPQNDDELELRVDDIITVITTELPDKGWWKGEIRGKVGVFPDNFVKMLAPSEAAPPPPRPRARARGGMGAGSGFGSGVGPGVIDGAAVRVPRRTQRGGSFEFLGARMASFITTIFAPINEPSSTAQPQRKISNTASTTSHMTTTNSSNSSTTSVTTQQQKEQIGSTTSKVYIKKTGSSSNSTTSSTTTASSSAGRKESFGSRDSLNDILSETGLPTGNVAAQRKSLENKNLDLTKPPGVGAAVAINQQRSSTSSATTSSATTISTGLTSSSVSKSTESMDEKVKSPPPPVLSKKPSVPLKKTPTGGVPVTAVGNLLSGKKKNPEGKLTTAVSHDLADGLTASKMLSGANQLPESGASGNLVIRRAATIAVEDTDFDRVERGSILTDMRQGRVKAPKRRPPSAAINVLGESNNNSVYVNGSGMGGGSGGAGSASELSEDGGAGGKGTAATASSDDNSTGEEPQLAKPKPREWEKKKAPWMEELKASQVTRKKTPSVEPRGASVAERTSKLFAAEQAISSSSSSTTTKVQSSAVTSSMFVENSTSSSVTTSSTSTTSNDAIMSRSLTAAKATAASSDEETRATRPNSLAIRNQRSVSPLVKSSNASSAQSQEEKSTNQLNNHQDASSSRVNQLEQRVDKLEGLVLNQQRTIEELVNALKSEAERVKILRSELDKYAHKQTRRGKFDNWMF